MQLLDLDWSLPVSHGVAVCSFVGPASLAPLLAAISHKISRLSLGGKRCTATLLSPSLYMYVCLALPSPCMYLFSNFVFSKFPQIPVFSCLLPRLELAIQSLVNILLKNIYSYCAKLQRLFKNPFIHYLASVHTPALCGTCSLETGALINHVHWNQHLALWVCVFASFSNILLNCTPFTIFYKNLIRKKFHMIQDGTMIFHNY